MQKFSKYFALLIVILYFTLGVFLLVSARFSYMKKEFRVIFAVFLFLYGSYRLARILTQRKQDEDE
jgi:general stress protein CsbA